ncbi:AhpC/TSA antioxidant enzyme [Nitzschia inconspicua]|uniref:AhpC/TSA antioxidant enzyme n=1 Tax=Nitzschia inconspicua TaxID=303405 RepID=A0A9K3M525_9STRA|nr:AhpC/TSA antioxidant enzyme [Nitzschia inconspicua]
MVVMLASKDASFSLAKKLVVTSAVAWMAASSSSTAAAMPIVPDRMMPSSTMKSMNWKDTSLIPVDLTIGVQEMSPALAGSQLAAVKRDTDQLEGFDLFGVIKETGVDDAGLTDFYKEYFTFPLYRDENLDFYRAFGDGKITDNMSWTSLFKPWRVVKEMRAMSQRLAQKNIQGNYKGEGLKTGGIIIFGADGTAKYAYPEVTGYELDMDEFLAAVQAVRDEETTSVTQEL